MPNNAPKKHHYLPVSFLRRFAADADESTRIVVHDLRTGDVRHSLPANTGCENHMYRVEADGITDPVILEKAFNIVETGFGIAMTNLQRTRAFPSDLDLNAILNFVALLIVRVPAFRERVRKTGDIHARGILRRSVSSEGYFELVRGQMIAAGYERAKDMSFAQMRDWFERGEFEIDTPQDLYALHLISGMHRALRILGMRSWRFVFIDGTREDVITSDNPVTLSWWGPPHRGDSLGLSNPRTVVAVPLSKRIIAMGLFVGEDGIDEGESKTALRMNHQQINHAFRFVYSATERFSLFDRNGTIRSGSSMIKAIVKSGRKAYDSPSRHQKR